MRTAATCMLTMTALFCLGVPMSAAKAEVIAKTRYTRHTVSGTTPVALVASMARHPIPQAGTDVVMGLLVMEQTFSYVPLDTGGRCRVGTLKSRLDFTITLPHARAVARFDGATKRVWDLFVAKVKHHELLHRSYFLDYAKRYEARAKRVTARDCRHVDRELARIAEEEYARAQDLNDRLDRHDSAEIDDLPLFVAARAGTAIGGQKLASTRP